MVSSSTLVNLVGCQFVRIFNLQSFRVIILYRVRLVIRDLVADAFGVFRLHDGIFIVWQIGNVFGVSDTCSLGTGLSSQSNVSNVYNR